MVTTTMTMMLTHDIFDENKETITVSKAYDSTVNDSILF